MCVGFALQDWLRAFECCVNRFSAVLQELATIFGDWQLLRISCGL
jgi:hypothetical protein